MRRDRIAKLGAAMEAAAVDSLVLCGQQNVSYATGARMPAADHVRASWWRAVAVLERGAPWPHLYTDFPEGAPAEWPDEFLHRAIEVETAAGAARARREARRGQGGDRRRAVPAVGRVARPGCRRCGRGDGSGQADEDARRARVHSSGPGHQRSRHARRAAVGGSRRARDRALGRVPARGRRARRDREHRRPRVPGDAVVGRRRARSASPASRCSRYRRAPTSCSSATSVDRHRYQPARLRVRLRCAHGSSDKTRTTVSAISSRAGRAVVDRALAACEAGRDRRPTSSTRLRPTTDCGPGCRTSTWPTASAPTARRCRSSGTTLGTEFDASITLQPGMVLVFEPVVWDDGARRPPFRGDRRGDGRRIRAAVGAGRRSTESPS